MNTPPWIEYVRFVITLVAVLDPFLAIPMFLAVTGQQSPAGRRRAAGLVAATVLAVLIGAAVTGDALLELMGASLPSFRVGGGIVLLMMALAMLNAQTGNIRQTSQEADELEQRTTVGIVPLAIPILAGPGAISTVILFAQQGGWAHRAVILGCILAVCGLLWVMLRVATRLGRALGVSGLNVANRLLGLLLTGIAVETMAAGLKQLFPVLGGT